MKQFLFILLLGLLYVNTIFANTHVPTPSPVIILYDGMEKLAFAKNVSAGSELAKSMKECFFLKKAGSSESELLPNDFSYFEYDKSSHSHNDPKLTSELYINKLENYIYRDGVMTVEKKISYSEYNGELPEFKKGKIIPLKSFIATYVTKTFIFNKGKANEQKMVYNDTVVTHTETNSIYSIYNGNGKSIIDKRKLKYEAAKYYSQKRYDDAYKCFESILAIDSNDGETLYRLGLMTYYGEGCNISSIRLRRSKGKEFMERASRSDVSTGFKDKADIVLFNWKYGSGIM